MFRFNIKATDLAEQSGISASRLSQFKGGQNVRIDTLDKILEALPPEARRFFLDHVAKSYEADSQSTPKLLDDSES